ncbi:hypothetical protein H012_gp384 [Acanthamoeba polyphaga moumouvirus]|uniref:Uncharacterized protein n=1 Tax=Acanthamoeba polyphaga moumouvirus TaxID=1269028 RepID=L7RGB8_9VIRU|nr:hypothetical protein H012_gp384 [Acanthamoeba polyphaga moumouvirus]AGC02075.1 hypothetical protein Moumou_00541 [Acanthamoeba polyphaga moumouvirus]
MNGYNIGNYKDLFIDINNFNEENITYVKPVLFYQVSKNMGVYYEREIKEDKKSTQSESKTKKKTKSENSSKKTNSDIAPIKHKKQKIIVHTPKMIIPFGVKEFDNKGKKAYNICLSFSTLTNLYNEDEIKKFYYFIKKIDKVNEETISEYIKPWKLPKNLKYKKTLQRLSEDFPHYMNITMPYDNDIGFLFNTYDEEGKKSSIDILKKRSIVSAVIELTDIKFTDKIFKSNWTIMQIRKFKPYSPIQEFFMTECFICDEDDPEDNVYAKLIEKYQKTLTTPISVPCFPQITGVVNPMIPFYNNQYPPNLYQNPYINTMPNLMNPPVVPPPPPSQKNNTQESASFKPPSLQELLSAKKLLKPTTTVIKEAPQGKVVEDGQDMSLPGPPPPPPLPKDNTEPSKKSSPKKSKEPIKTSKKTKEVQKSSGSKSSNKTNKGNSKSSAKIEK